MTPRTQMIGLERELTVEQAADEVAQAKRSRYPVYAESLDDIVGVVHAKDILTAVRQAPGTTVASIMRAPLFVPGTREVEDVLADMPVIWGRFRRFSPGLDGQLLLLEQLAGDRLTGPARFGAGERPKDDLGFRNLIFVLWRFAQWHLEMKRASPCAPATIAHSPYCGA